MRLHGFTGKDRRDVAVAGEGDIDDELVTGHAGEFEEFKMQRIVLDGAFHGAGLAHEAGAVDDFDGFLRGEAGDDEFAAS